MFYPHVRQKSRKQTTCKTIIVIICKFTKSLSRSIFHGNSMRWILELQDSRRVIFYITCSNIIVCYFSFMSFFSQWFLIKGFQWDYEYKSICHIFYFTHQDFWRRQNFGHVGCGSFLTSIATKIRTTTIKPANGWKPHNTYTKPFNQCMWIHTVSTLIPLLL